MGKRKKPSYKRAPRANTIRDRRLAIRNSIGYYKRCPRCNELTLIIGGTCSNGKQVWTYCSSCELNKTGDVSLTYTNLTEWFDVYCTIVDANVE